MAQRRDKGSGYVASRPNGKGLWPGYATIEGKRRYVYGRTRTDVRLKVAALYQQQQSPKAEPLRVGVFLERWLQAVREGRVSRRQATPSTVARYESIVRVHLVPGIGHHRLASLSADDLDACYAAIERSHTASTAAMVHTVIRTALSWAWRRGLVPTNVALRTHAPATSPQVRHALSETEVSALLSAAAGTDDEALLWLLIGTGLRFGELAALRWSDLDLAHGLIVIARKVGRIKAQGMTVSDPKTTAGARTMTLPRVIVERLVAHQERQAEVRKTWKQDLNLVFPTTTGTYRESQNFRNQRWIPLLKRTILSDGSSLYDRYGGKLTVHELRHTASSFLLRLGVDVKTAQSRLGHARAGTTLNTYGHALLSADREAAEKLDALLREII